MARQMLVVGNWKMNGLSDDIPEIVAISEASKQFADVETGLCLPATLIDRAARAAPGFAIGGQDVDKAEKGAHTGCVSTAMLKDAGSSMVIVGHSERREAQRESDEDVRAKAAAALSAGLLTILCIGESLAVREGGGAIPTVLRQLEASFPREVSIVNLAVAYEPIWAIGTGRTATAEDIGAMHSAIRAKLGELSGEDAEPVRILYGGSVKPDNAGEIFAVGDVDGALVGGASLKAADFVPIIEAATLKA